MIRASTLRVPRATAEEVNREIRRQTEQRLSYYAAHPEKIDERLWQLDREWDTERVLETSAATVSLTGFALGIFRGRRWVLLTVAAAGFLLQHALQGWCPPLPIVRRLGVRTRAEIEEERYALKALRNDFQVQGAADKCEGEKVSLILGALGR